MLSNLILNDLEKVKKYRASLKAKLKILIRIVHNKAKEQNLEIKKV